METIEIMTLLILSPSKFVSELAMLCFIFAEKERSQ
jgi:hypothetical protein